MNKHKHYDVIIAFANGAQIEGRPTPNSAWSLFPNPSWENDWEYRIKTEKDEPWKPKDGESYYFVDTDAECVETSFDINWTNDRLRIKSGNYFHTREEAEAAAERVKAALKGTTDVSANVGSNVGSKEAEIKALKEELETLRIRCNNLHKAKEKLIASHAAIDSVTLTAGEIALIRAMRSSRICRFFEDFVVVEKHDHGVATHRPSLAFFTQVPSDDAKIKAAIQQIKAEQEADHD